MGSPIDSRSVMTRSFSRRSSLAVLDPTPSTSTGPARSAERSTIEEDDDAGDDSSLTSLSDLERGDEDKDEDDQAREVVRKRASTGSTAETSRVAEPTQADVPHKLGKNAPRSSSSRTGFPAPATPQLDKCLSRTQGELQAAIGQATEDYDLQTRSEVVVQEAVESLPTSEQQTMMCLAMNRYSAFCATESADLPPFPITPFKIVLFLSRSLDTPCASDLLRRFPQPPTYPLPLVDDTDTSLTVDEGYRVTRELFGSWIQALGFAQMVTMGVWDNVVGEGQWTNPSSRIVPLAEDGAVQEMIEAVPTMQWWVERGKMGRKDSASAKKTRWVKGGRAVAGPAAATSRVRPCETSPTAPADHRSLLASLQPEPTYSFTIPPLRAETSHDSDPPVFERDHGSSTGACLSGLSVAPVQPGPSRTACGATSAPVATSSTFSIDHSFDARPLPNPSQLSRSGDSAPSGLPDPASILPLPPPYPTTATSPFANSPFLQVP
ncbi:hypothetical protein JCM10212_004835 [Sporobolomyces blumeae]